jgi:hypothetical protein
MEKWTDVPSPSFIIAHVPLIKKMTTEGAKNNSFKPQGSKKYLSLSFILYFPVKRVTTPTYFHFFPHKVIFSMLGKFFFFAKFFFLDFGCYKSLFAPLFLFLFFYYF